MSGKETSASKAQRQGDCSSVKNNTVQRDGMNLVYDLGVNFVDATLGTSVEVLPLTAVKVKIPANLSVKYSDFEKKGCLPCKPTKPKRSVIQMNVWTPKNLAPEETALYSKSSQQPRLSTARFTKQPTVAHAAHQPKAKAF